VSSNNDLTDSYEVLGLDPSASVDDVRQAYLALVQAWEPQSIQDNPGLLSIVEEKNQAINQAYRAIAERISAEATAQTLPPDSATDSAIDTALEPRDLTDWEDTNDAQLSAPTDPSTSLHNPGLAPETAPHNPQASSPNAQEEETLPDPLTLEHPEGPDAAGPDPVDPDPDRTYADRQPADRGQTDRDYANRDYANRAQTDRDYAAQPATRVESRSNRDIPVRPTVVETIADDFGRAGAATMGVPMGIGTAIFKLFRWDKPAGRLILMIPALWAFFLAHYMSGLQPNYWLLLIILLGSVAASAAGCVVNDLWDRDIDSQVERTRNRPLAIGALSGPVAIGLAILAFLAAWYLAARLINPVSFWLCVAAIPVILLYPGAKRVFPVPQLVLSLAWGFAVLITWTAVSDLRTITEAPVLMLWGATVLWTLGFDTIYAMADREDDRRLGIQSSALFFGKQAPNMIGLCFVGTALLLIWLGWTIPLGRWYWVSLILAAFGWLWQHRSLATRPQNRGGYTHLFTQNVWIGFFLLIGIIMSTAYA
jgi:4-hydroxybenzoate polyprenyltransferase